MLSVATDAQAQDKLRLDLDELVREGARRMLDPYGLRPTDRGLCQPLSCGYLGGLRTVPTDAVRTQ
jgi:hypothetical protein